MPARYDQNLRDYFAGCALTGILMVSWTSSMTADDFARSAYEVADAMLRAKPQETEKG